MKSKKFKTRKLRFGIYIMIATVFFSFAFGLSIYPDTYYKSYQYLVSQFYLMSFVFFVLCLEEWFQ
jgi:hypothetical protein